MAFGASDLIKVTINEQEITGIRSVDLGSRVPVAPAGHPQDSRPQVDVIRIVRESDDNLAFWSWAIRTSNDGWQDGKIEFMDQKGQKKAKKTVSWKNGWVSQYEEGLTVDTAEYGGSPILETVEIAVGSLTIDGVTIPPGA